MRPDEIDGALDELPYRIARFDDAGIDAACSEVDASEMLATFTDLIKQGGDTTRRAIIKVFETSPAQRVLLDQLARVTEGVQQFLAQLPPSPAVEVVSAALKSFLNFLQGG